MSSSTSNIYGRPAQNGGDIYYDNSTSGLTADDLQAAIDELNLTGSGDAMSSATSADNSIARYSGTNNKTIQSSSSVLLDDSDNITGVASITSSGSLTMSSTTGSILPPRLTIVERDALTPLNGMTIYNTDYNRLESYNSSTTFWEGRTRTIKIDFTAQSDTIFYPIIFHDLIHSPVNFSINKENNSVGVDNELVNGMVINRGWTDGLIGYNILVERFQDIPAQKSCLGIWRGDELFKGFAIYARGGYEYIINSACDDIAGHTALYTTTTEASNNSTFDLKNAAGADLGAGSVAITEMLNIIDNDEGNYISHDVNIVGDLVATGTVNGLDTSLIVINNGAATDNAIARFDTATGKLIKDSLVSIDNSGNLSGIANITLSGSVVGVDIATRDAISVVNNSSGADNAIPRFDIDGRTIQNSGVLVDDSDNVSAIGTLTNTSDITTGGSIFYGTDTSMSRVRGTFMSLIALTSMFTGQLCTIVEDSLVAKLTQVPAGDDKVPIVGVVKQNNGGGNTTTIIQTSGIACCMVEVAATISIGDKVRPSLSVAGRVVSTTGNAAVVGIALATITGDSGGLCVPILLNISRGSADVVGPSVSVDNTIARFNGTDKTIDDCGVTIDDSDNISGANNITIGGEIISTNSNNVIFGIAEHTSLTGNNDVLIGRSAGTALTTGNWNTLCGASTVCTAGAYNQNCFGQQAEATKNNQVVLGDAQIIETLIRGQAVLTTGPTTTARDLLDGIEGGLIYNSTENKVNICVSTGTGASNWERVHSGAAIEIDELDTALGNPLLIGKANASQIEIGDTGIITEVNGTLNCIQGYSTAGVGGLLLSYKAASPSSYFAGGSSGNSLTSGGSNLFLGDNSGQAVVTTGSNVALGHNSNVYSTGQQNVSIGAGSYQGVISVTTGGNNTMIGTTAGSLFTTGSSNTMLGYAATGLITADNQTALGNGAECTKANQVVIGDTNVVETVLNGTVLLDGGIAMSTTTAAFTLPRLSAAQVSTFEPSAISGDLIYNTSLKRMMTHNSLDFLECVMSTPTANDNELTISSSNEDTNLTSANLRIQSNSVAIAAGGSLPTADASALLTLTSTAKGFLPPRMTSAERTAISTPATGLMLYNTTTNVVEVYNGSTWKVLAYV